MSLFDYRQSQKGNAACDSFAGLIMAALRRADSQNAAKLKIGWPEICAEFRARYRAPRGLLDGETDSEGWSRSTEGVLRGPGGGESPVEAAE